MYKYSAYNLYLQIVVIIMIKLILINIIYLNFKAIPCITFKNNILIIYLFDFNRCLNNFFDDIKNNLLIIFY